MDELLFKLTCVIDKNKSSFIDYDDGSGYYESPSVLFSSLLELVDCRKNLVELILSKPGGKNLYNRLTHKEVFIYECLNNYYSEYKENRLINQNAEIYNENVSHIDSFVHRVNSRLDIPNTRNISHSAHEGDLFMNLPLILLAIFSIFFGYISKDIFIGLGSAFFADNSLFIHSIHEIMLDTEFAVNTIFKLLPLVFTISLSALAIIISEFFPNLIIHFKLSRLGYNIFGFFNQRFFIELLYNKYISGLFYYKLGGQTSMVLDKGSVELLGPFGLEKSLVNLSRNISYLSTGVITYYALYIFIGLILYISLPSLALQDISLFVLSLLGLLSIKKY